MDYAELTVLVTVRDDGYNTLAEKRLALTAETVRELRFALRSDWLSSIVDGVVQAAAAPKADEDPTN